MLQSTILTGHHGEWAVRVVAEGVRAPMLVRWSAAAAHANSSLVPTEAGGRFELAKPEAWGIGSRRAINVVEGHCAATSQQGVENKKHMSSTEHARGVSAGWGSVDAGAIST